jgi:Electron transfer DM13
MPVPPALTSLLHKPVTWLVLAAGAVAAVVGLALFQPWKLWVDETVDEALPAAAPGSGASATPGSATPGSATPGSATPGSATPGSATPGSATPGSTGEPTAGSAAGGPATLVGGRLISHEHRTSGTVRVLRLADGSRILRLENLDTSNGPDLKVWLTDAPVLSGRRGWHVFDDGRYVNLGRLKGNKGSQNYPVPADLDLDRYPSVSIWCDRFNVSFGAATLSPP